MSSVAVATFANNLEYPWGSCRWVSVSPYAFCAHLPPLRAADFILLDGEQPDLERLSKYDVVYATATLKEQADMLLGLPNVVSGGPAIGVELLENYLGSDASSTITKCWEQPDMPVISLGWGCVHGACRYCNYDGAGLRIRPEIPKILKQIHSYGDGQYWLAIEGPPSWLIAEVIKSEGPAIFKMYARPTELLKALEMTDTLGNRLSLSIGLEALSDKTLKRFNRGHTVAAALRSAEAAMDLGIDVVLMIMGPHPGEAEHLDTFKQWYDRNCHRNIKLLWNGPTVFYNKPSDDYIQVDDGNWVQPLSVSWALAWEEFAKYALYAEFTKVDRFYSAYGQLMDDAR